jgi:regulator of sigma E protease
LEAIIGDVSKGLPAQKAGLTKGDKIVAVNDQQVDSWDGMRKAIAAGEGKELKITVLRQDTVFDVKITPKLTKIKNAIGETEERYMIGISATKIKLADEDQFIKRLNPWEAFKESIARTYFVAEISIVGVKKIIEGSISKKNLGGPIMIAKIAGDQAREGIDKLIQFIAFISINLAIINILPIPVLDGGHLLFFFIEAAIRRPVGIRIREIAQQAGMFILFLLIVFVFYNDIVRYFVKT